MPERWIDRRAETRLDPASAGAGLGGVARELAAGPVAGDEVGQLGEQLRMDVMAVANTPSVLAAKRATTVIPS
jgi:hypothetical protein